MKPNPRFPILLFWILSSCCIQSVSGSFGFLFGGGTCNTGNKEDDLACKINQIYKSAGLQKLEVVAANDREQGKKAMDCMASISGLNVEERFGVFGFAKTIVMNMVYEHFYTGLTEERVDRLCAVAQQRSTLRRQLKSEHQEASNEGMEKQGSNLRRRLGDPTSPVYPASSSEMYKAWADTYIVEYLPASTFGVTIVEDQRADIDQMTTLILDPLIETRQTIVDSGLAVSRDIVEIVCNVLGSVELGFDPGDACRIISSSIQLAATISETAQAELETELLAVQTHNGLIDSAELQATHADAATLVTDLTR